MKIVKFDINKTVDLEVKELGSPCLYLFYQDGALSVFGEIEVIKTLHEVKKEIGFFDEGSLKTDEWFPLFIDGGILLELENEEEGNKLFSQIKTKESGAKIKASFFNKEGKIIKEN